MNDTNDIPEEIRKMFPNDQVHKLDIDDKGELQVLGSAEPLSPEPDFEDMPIELINQYLQEHGYDPEQVGIRGKILVDSLIENISLRERAEKVEIKFRQAHMTVRSILQSALAGYESTYKDERGYIKWGEVSRDIEKAFCEQISSSSKSSRDLTDSEIEKLEQYAEAHDGEKLLDALRLTAQCETVQNIVPQDAIVEIKRLKSSSEKSNVRVMRLETALKALRSEKHRVCEDCYYSCPKSDDYCGEESDCDCGTDRQNKIIDDALSLEKQP